MKTTSQIIKEWYTTQDALIHSEDLDRLVQHLESYKNQFKQAVIAKLDERITMHNSQELNKVIHLLIASEFDEVKAEIEADV